MSRASPSLQHSGSCTSFGVCGHANSAWYVGLAVGRPNDARAPYIRNVLANVVMPRVRTSAIDGVATANACGQANGMGHAVPSAPRTPNSAFNTNPTRQGFALCRVAG